MNFNDIWLQKQLLQKQLGKIPKVNLKLPDINLKGLAAQAAGVDAPNINKSPSVRRAVRGSNAIATNQNLRQMTSPVSGLVGAVAMSLSDKYLSPLAAKAGEELIYLIPQKRDERNRLRALQKQNEMEKAWGLSGGGTMGKSPQVIDEQRKTLAENAWLDSSLTNSVIGSLDDYGQLVRNPEDINKLLAGNGNDVDNNTVSNNVKVEKGKGKGKRFVGKGRNSIAANKERIRKINPLPEETSTGGAGNDTLSGDAGNDSNQTSAKVDKTENTWDAIGAGAKIWAKLLKQQRSKGADRVGPTSIQSRYRYNRYIA